MSKDSNTQHKATRQHPPTKIIVERHYVGTEKMETFTQSRLCRKPHPSGKTDQDHAFQEKTVYPVCRA